MDCGQVLFAMHLTLKIVPLTLPQALSGPATPCDPAFCNAGGLDGEALPGEFRNPYGASFPGLDRPHTL